ncbi:MAG TPA: hypothetical protein VF659_22195 [Pyrinomonadaceae bacterium]
MSRRPEDDKRGAPEDGGAKHDDGGAKPTGIRGRLFGVPRGMSRLERAEWFFTFLAFFAGFFYLTRAAKTDLQWYFRVVSIFVGVAGWMAVQILKRRR